MSRRKPRAAIIWPGEYFGFNALDFPVFVFSLDKFLPAPGFVVLDLPSLVDVPTGAFCRLISSLHSEK
jgi:hypothetical protein